MTEFIKLRRLLQRKRHIKIKLYVRLSVLRLFHVGHVVQSRRSALSNAWHEWFSCKGREWKIYCCQLALSSEPQKWKFHVVVWQTTSKHCAKNCAARAARLFFLFQPIKSLVCGVDVVVAVVIFKLPSDIRPYLTNNGECWSKASPTLLLTLATSPTAL